MADFCYSCYRTVLEGARGRGELVLSKELELCEGCGRLEPVVLCTRTGLSLWLGKLLCKKK